MKAVQISEYGGPSVAQVRDVEKPVVGEGRVLVEVKAASLNPFDTKIREGYMKEVIPLQFPSTLGGDIAGVVAEVGAGVEGFAVGDKVYGQANVVAGNSGAFAEYAATKADQIAHSPKNLDFTDAAAMPLVGVSALQALTEHLNLRSGQKILIHGGAGGIGSIAIQIAKHIGAYVATTASAEAAGFVKGLGADEVIDYASQDFTTLVRDYDAVFDTVGGEVLQKSAAVLKKGGVVVSMAGKVDDAVAAEYGITSIGQSTKVTTERLNKLTEFIEQGVIKPEVAKVFPLDDVQAAFEFREAQHYTGKVVLQVGA